ncbi:synaptobrevin family protein [Cardiosporidium cionae]|uniref:Synaptobrevin family protein n=1 Tax=Cardiosporidium cionae TaxID=476202 RepID=A0ABQ7J4D9_9APIC|nr:synaptobrevin family protein [Cardiosporidium cionae]|eukprot:KAF8817943.1 synaptobrevin family protein [Cardiosporidium cionae]
MCELAFLCRASDALLLAETWDNLTTNAEQKKWKAQAKEILKKVNRLRSPGCIEDLTHSFYYLSVDGICYMTVCANSYPKKLAFAFLEDIQRSFVEELKREYGTHSMDYRSLIETIEKPYYFIKFGSSKLGYAIQLPKTFQYVPSVILFALISDRIIQRKKQDYRNPNSTKALQKLNEGLTEVSNIMRRNITDILERGERLEVQGDIQNINAASLDATICTNIYHCYSSANYHCMENFFLKSPCKYS